MNTKRGFKTNVRNNCRRSFNGQISKQYKRHRSVSNNLSELQTTENIVLIKKKKKKMPKRWNIRFECYYRYGFFAETANFSQRGLRNGVLKNGNSWTALEVFIATVVSCWGIKLRSSYIKFSIGLMGVFLLWRKFRLWYMKNLPLQYRKDFMYSHMKYKENNTHCDLFNVLQPCILYMLKTWIFIRYSYKYFRFDTYRVNVFIINFDLSYHQILLQPVHTKLNHIWNNTSEITHPNRAISK